jgi:hypothetical protein
METHIRADSRDIQFQHGRETALVSKADQLIAHGLRDKQSTTSTDVPCNCQEQSISSADMTPAFWMAHMNI